MDVKLTKRPVPLVTVAGDIDRYTAPRVTACLRQAAHSGRDIILDLSQVDFLDTRGADQVYLAGRYAGEHGGRAAVIVTSPNINRILEMLGLFNLPSLAIVSDMDSAIKYLRGDKASDKAA